MVRSSPARADYHTSGWRSFRGPRFWLVPPGFFAIVAVLEATHAWIGGEPVIGLTLQEQPLSGPALVARTMPSWLFVGLLAPFVILLARRYPLSGAGWNRSVAVHLGGAVLFAAVFLLGASFLRFHLFLAGQRGLTWGFTGLRYYAVYFNTFFFNYWALVAVHSAFRSQERHREAVVLEKQLAEARLRTLQAQLRRRRTTLRDAGIRSCRQQHDPATLTRTEQAHAAGIDPWVMSVAV